MVVDIVAEFFKDIVEIPVFSDFVEDSNL